MFEAVAFAGEEAFNRAATFYKCVYYKNVLFYF